MYIILISSTGVYGLYVPIIIMENNESNVVSWHIQMKQ